jgi:hypothetical protein
MTKTNLAAKALPERPRIRMFKGYEGNLLQTAGAQDGAWLVTSAVNLLGGLKRTLSERLVHEVVHSW